MRRRDFLRVASGAAATTAAGTGAAAAQTETATPAGTATGTAGAGETATGGGGGGGGGSVTVDLVDYAFEPGTDSPLEIPPGTTVEFVWQTSNHNIVVEQQPQGSDWQGHDPIENEGFTHSHTFTTEGDYHYYCQPHQGLGMVADLTVAAGATLPGAGGGGEGGGQPVIPDSAKTLGVATSVAMVSTLGLAYFLLKYGGDYGDAEGE